MNRFFTLLLAASCLTAVGQVTYPYNPDGNADGLIGLSDMLDVLSLYGLGFEIDGLSVWSTELDSTNATGWPNVPDFDPDNPPRVDIPESCDVAWLTFVPFTYTPPQGGAWACNDGSPNTWILDLPVDSSWKSLLVIGPQEEFYFCPQGGQNQGFLGLYEQDYLRGGLSINTSLLRCIRTPDTRWRCSN